MSRVEDKVGERVDALLAAEAALSEAHLAVGRAQSQQKQKETELVKCISAIGKERILYKGWEYWLVESEDGTSRWLERAESNLFVVQ